MRTTSDQEIRRIAGEFLGLLPPSHSLPDGAAASPSLRVLVQPLFHLATLERMLKIKKWDDSASIRTAIQTAQNSTPAILRALEAHMLSYHPVRPQNTLRDGSRAAVAAAAPPSHFVWFTTLGGIECNLDDDGQSHYFKPSETLQSLLDPRPQLTRHVNI